MKPNIDDVLDKCIEAVVLLPSVQEFNALKRENERLKLLLQLIGSAVAEVEEPKP